MAQQNKKLRILGSQSSRNAYLLMLPAISVVGLIVVVPSLLSIFNSFFSWNLFRPNDKSFSFLSNYQAILSDQTFWRSMRFTFGFIIVTMSIELCLGMGAALIVNKMPQFWRKIATTFILIPYLLAPLTVGLIWKLLFTYEGLINGLLQILNIAPIAWMTGASSAFFASTIAEIWRSYPFGFLMLLSAMSSFPTEPYEAAIVDGASKFQIFRFITVPFCRPTLVIILIYQIVMKLRVFDLVYLLTGGGPVDYTTPLGLLIYRYYFRYYEAGYGSAAAVIVLICSIIISAVIIRNMHKES